jgi:transcription initiation factor TFIID TATA-box-binding protein
MTKKKIVNVVATASLNQELSFVKLREFEEIFYNPELYGGRVAYFKTDPMIGRISLFSTGKMISVGTKTKKDAFFELELAERFLVQKRLVEHTQLKPQIHNIVATLDVEKSLNLEKIAESPKVIYEPEQFPAIILHLEQPYKASILIFSSGKIVITGLKSSEEIDQTIAQVLKFIDDKQSSPVC